MIRFLVLFSFFILVLRIAGFNCRGTTISYSEEGGGVGSSSHNSPLLSKYSLLPLFSTIFLLSSSCSEVQSRAILLNFILMGPGPDPSSVTALFLKYRGHKSHFILTCYLLEFIVEFTAGMKIAGLPRDPSTATSTIMSFMDIFFV